MPSSSSFSVLSFLAASLSLSLAACTADTTNAANESTGQAQSRATFSLSPTEVFAKRMPMNAGCGEKNVPFSDDDRFSLQPVNAAAPNGVGSIAIKFRRTVTKDVAQELTIGGSVGGATIEGAAHASSADEVTGIGLVVFGTPNALDKPLAKATVAITEIPEKDGDPTSAHVTLEFTDGDILDETFTGNLVSYEGACGGG